jgi:cell division protein ZapA (FtsZ GTPase activity inhibitor)
LLVMASLLISDELSETFSNLNSVDDNGAVDAAAEAEQVLAQTTEALAQRIELIAEKLEPA